MFRSKQFIHFQRGNINRFHGVLVFDLIKLQNGKSLECALKKKKSFNLTLPELEGAASGISDAYFLVEKNLIIATAAVEQTLNTYDDGAVLGSFILIFSPEGKKFIYTFDSGFERTNSCY